VILCEDGGGGAGDVEEGETDRAPGKGEVAVGQSFELSEEVGGDAASGADDGEEDVLVVDGGR